MSELVIINDHERDLLEERLAAERDKINMEERRNNGMRVILYLIMSKSVLTIYCEDERTNSSAEFEVAPKEAYDWFDHAFAHPDANLDHYSQADNSQGYGA